MAKKRKKSTKQIPFWENVAKHCKGGLGSLLTIAGFIIALGVIHNFLPIKQENIVDSVKFLAISVIFITSVILYHIRMEGKK